MNNYELFILLNRCDFGEPAQEGSRGYSPHNESQEVIGVYTRIGTNSYKSYTRQLYR